MFRLRRALYSSISPKGKKLKLIILPKFDWVVSKATMLVQPGITEAKFDWVFGKATLLYKV